MKWDDPAGVLEVASDLLAVTLTEIVSGLSEVLATLAPHRTLITFSGDCPRAPLRVHGSLESPATITAGEVTRLASTVAGGDVVQVEAMLGGRMRRVLAVAAAQVDAVLVVVPDAEVDAGAVRKIQALWQVLAVHLSGMAARGEPAALTGSRAAAGERTRLVAAFADTHQTTLTAIQGVLRSRSLDDATARRIAADITASALVELRTNTGAERRLGTEAVGAAFTRLVRELDPFARHAAVSLEPAPPRPPDRRIPTDAATAAHAICRALVQLSTDQREVRRIRLAWNVSESELVVSVRDDGPGAIDPESAAVRQMTERVLIADGTLSVEAVPTWGSTFTARLPLRPAQRETLCTAPALSTLNPREHDVLAHLAEGRRNRDIATRLGISESTVKFHVGNILAKLAVRTRGEAAALSRGRGRA